MQRQKDLLKIGIFFIVALTLWGGIHVWTRILSVELGYSISEQQGIKEDLLAENKALKVEISTLKSSGRLQTIANDLGFCTPNQGQVIYLWQEE